MDLVRTSSAEERRQRLVLEQRAEALRQQTAAMERELAETEHAIAQMGGAGGGSGSAGGAASGRFPAHWGPPPRPHIRDWLGGSKGGGDIFGLPQPPITELAFGDELSHPITVLAADFECCVLPDQQSALVKTTLLVTNEVRKRLFCAIFVLKMIILPRQARDKHRKS